MKNWGFVLFIILWASLSSAQVPQDCEKNVERTYQKRLANLLFEGIVTKSLDDTYQSTLTTEQLYADPRFRNFPAISLQTIQWCQKIEVVQQSIDFLEKVGFRRASMDQYFKKLLYASKNTSLVVRKDQVGETLTRQKFIDWIQQNPSKEAYKHLVSHYAMAVYKNGDKILARAGANYIGNFLGEAVFTLPYHALFVKDQKISCKDFEFYFPKTPSAPVMAQKTLLSVPTMDVIFCGLKLDAPHSELTPASLNAKTLQKNTGLLTLGVGTDAVSKKLALTIDASQECRTLVTEDQATIYDSGILDSITYRWSMGCDVSEGNSGDGLYNQKTGELVAFVTSRSAYTYQNFASQIFSEGLDQERLYLETSHFIPLSQIRSEVIQISKESTVEELIPFINWFLKITESSKN